MLRRTMLATTATAAMAFGTTAFAQDMDIVETAQSAGNFTTLVSALGTAGLAETLKGDGPFTVFAPTDDAFAKLDQSTLDSLMMPENSDQLTAILNYHVVPGAVMSGDLTDGMTATTAEGSDVEITLDPVMVNDATVTQPDIEASNGVIHAIDTVLMPSGM